MDKHVLLFAVAATTFSLSCFAQYNERFQVSDKEKNMRLIADRISQKDFTIVSYHVEEKINLRFGSTTTTYTVPTLNMVNTNDLGENNTRTVTPKYVRTKPKILDYELPNPSFSVATIKPIKVDITIQKEKRTYVRVNVLRTYERVLENGYLSTEMLKKVADWRYFEGDLAIAAKWYTELYCLASEQETNFYYRYAQSLHSIGQTEKANEMMKIYQSKQ